MKKYDYLIVGSGLFGAVFARYAVDNGKSCLVIEKRSHPGGNLYCKNINGINVHEYGAHIFHTNNRRVWEYDDDFKGYLRQIRALAVDMETATLFTCGFANHISTGALLLVSDQPLISTGVKTEKSDQHVTENFVEEHVKIGIKSLSSIMNHGSTIKHLRFDW